MSERFGPPPERRIEGADALRVAGPTESVPERLAPDETAVEDVRPPVAEEPAPAERPSHEDEWTPLDDEPGPASATTEPGEDGAQDEPEPAPAQTRPEEARRQTAPETVAEASPAGTVIEAPPPEISGPAGEAPAEHAPGELEIPDGVGVFVGSPNGTRRSVGIAVAAFNGDISTKLLDGALEALAEAGVDRARVDVMRVPGAFELPLAAMALAKTRRYACVLALGCVIRGDTPHFEYVASEAASGIQLAALETGVPVSFGVLTCDSRAQAEARAGGGHGNKGAEAARSGLEMADVFARLRADAVVADRR